MEVVRKDVVSGVEVREPGMRISLGERRVTFFKTHGIFCDMYHPKSFYI